MGIDPERLQGLPPSGRKKQNNYQVFRNNISFIGVGEMERGRGGGGGMSVFLYIRPSHFIRVYDNSKIINF